MSQYLRTDEQHDVLVSLREVRCQLQHIDQDINCWKWALIALASAVNGALTCNLTGTMQVGALDDRTANKMMAALQHDSTDKYPEPRLANPYNLLRRATGREDRIERAGQNLTVSASQEKSFELLFQLRNQFIHFKPTGWSIETSGLPAVFTDVMQIIEGTIDDFWSFRDLEESFHQEIRAQHDEIIQELKRFTREQ